LSGRLVSAAVLTKECAMHDVLKQQAAQLARLVMRIRIGLDSAESAIPGINDLLAVVAVMGVTEFQVEGPAVYCRPAGPSSAYADSFVVYQAAIVQPGGVGAVLLDAADYDEHTSPPYGEPVDLAFNFIAYDKCPTIVRALLVAHTGRLLEQFMGDMRLLGS
jgi:hypothetical protein